MNFTAIDFETANNKRASACSLAITVIRNNKIVDEFYTLINPEVEFNWRNIKVHGLHAEDVTDAPTFPEIWPIINHFFTYDKLVIAHNNSFDNSVLKNTLLRYDLIVPKYLTLDTVKTSKYFFPEFENHKLDTVCENMNIDLHHHHNALDDSLACANILIKQQKEFGNDAIKQFIKVKK
ncbi:exonuclease [Apilactobacillus timberlakei]|uniref:3'-5' exonuclease n=1 Tax=Apilactobacillus timberlakei TaxID=2008380 RepID=UPI00112CC3A6|nr:3'-5' exonuclease [Apilactobacillus timberlakei]TPR17964.1 exonuclease [Apilactobacillus timberlakei]TPR19770.1 exonuclease [Apilactobacillus timberlakei]TPR21276.1 exonuclease [Apilactobacillus timberlakei]TPR22483.1 exonuclease [Apilactobacillus timberlakei]